MGRPKVHDQQTAASLLQRAERIAEEDGLSALSLRRLADETSTSTRAVYSLFGSKNALVAALGAKAFERLGELVAAAPLTDDPISDLVEAGVTGFRRLVIDHPVLFQIGVQGDWPAEISKPITISAQSAWQQLLARTERLHAANQLGSRTAQRAAMEFHALCEGLAAIETRGMLATVTHDGDEMWRSSLRALVVGFTAS